MIAHCGKGSIEVKEIQPEGKRPMSIKDFARGWRGNPEGMFDREE
jgi:methionyl-tRNA formyltransferase